MYTCQNATFVGNHVGLKVVINVANIADDCWSKYTSGKMKDQKLVKTSFQKFLKQEEWSCRTLNDFFS